MEKTKKAIGEFCKLIKVPNWEKRLNEKDTDFIFDLGVFISSPLLDDEEIEDVMRQMDHILDYTSFDEATEALKEKIKEKEKHLYDSLKYGISNLLNKVFKNTDIDVFQADMGVSIGEYNKRLERAKEMSSLSKISELLSIGNKLGKDISTSKYYDQLHDLSIENPEWFNMIYIMLSKLMQDDHYKTCNCISEKYDFMIFSSDRHSAIDKILNRI